MRIYCLLFLVFLPLAIEAQKYIHSNYHYNLEKGLTSRNIRCAYKDSNGRMWFGSDVAVYHFDGFEFHSYETPTSSSIPYSTFMILEDSEQNLWFFHNDQTLNKEAISILPKNKEKLIPIDQFFGDQFPFPTDELAPNLTNAFEKNGIWIANKKTRAIYEFDKGELIKVGTIPEVEKQSDLGHLYCIDKDSQGTLWISIDNTLFKKVAGSNKFVKDSDLAYPFRIKIDAADKMWFSFMNAFLERAHQEAPIIQSPFRNEVSNSEAFFIESFNEDYLVAFDRSEKNIKLIDKASKKSIIVNCDSQLKLKNLDAVRIYIDDNIVWVCTYEGIYQTIIEKNPFQNYLKSKSIRGIIKSPKDSNLVVTSYSGYFSIDPSTQKEQLLHPIRNPLSCGNNVIVGANNNLWYGGKKSAFYEITSTQPFKYNLLQNKKGTGDILNFYKHETSGQYFAGSDKGILKYNTIQHSFDTISCIGKFSKLKQSSVFDYEFLDSENFLAATSSGIYQIDINKGVTNHFGEFNNTFPKTFITYIYKDVDDTYWIGTKLGGLFNWKYPETTLSHFTTENGLIDNTIYSIHEDPVHTDYLWIPTNNGLMHFNKFTHEVTTYKTEEGIMHDEFNVNSCFVSADSTFYFGGIQGITSFNPKDIIVEDKRANVILSEFKTYEKESKSKTSKLLDFYNNKIVKLHPNKSDVDITVGMSDYRNPYGNEFYYKIDEDTDEWIKMKENSITITGLSYGNQTVSIKGKSAKGIWSANEIQLKVRRLLPIYLRWWFIGLALLLLTAAVRVFIWRRTRLLEIDRENLAREVARRTQKIEEDKKLIEKQAEELQQLDEIKSRFFANVTHELRTPLTLIIGPLQQLLKSSNLDSDKARKTLESISQNGNQLKQLVEEILDLNRLDAKKIVLNKEPVRLRNLIEKWINNFNPEAENRNIKFNLDYTTSTNLYLNIDAHKLERIVVNLLSNAFKYSENGDTVTLKISELPKQMKIEIVDTGLGIHEADIPHIFERFYQTKQAENSLMGGLGIGLALSKELSELMGGKLSVVSKLGVGSTFKFSFPKEAVEEIMIPIANQNSDVVHTSPERPEVIMNRRLRNILIVEDNLGMQSFVIELLNKVANVHTANNGKLAIEFLEKQTTPIDLIISDVMMPEMDGFTFLKLIRQRKEWQLTPIVFLTARADILDRIKAFTIGVDDYLVKPFEPDELIARVKNLLDKITSRQEIEIADEKEAVIEKSSTIEKKSATGLELINGFEETESADLIWLKNLEQKVIDNIEQPNFNVSQLAFMVHIGERQLGRKLKKLTGMTPGSYLKEVRLQKARHLLENKTFSTISEVAFHVGFKTPEYFSKIFKARFGKLPTEYTKNV